MTIKTEVMGRTLDKVNLHSMMQESKVKGLILIHKVTSQLGLDFALLYRGKMQRKSDINN